MKLSARQDQVIRSIKDGCTLVRHFDVYGGYWWTLSPTNEKVLRPTVDALVNRGAVIAGENKRIHSGYHEMEYSLPSTHQSGEA